MKPVSEDRWVSNEELNEACEKEAARRAYELVDRNIKGPVAVRDRREAMSPAFFHDELKAVGLSDGVVDLEAGGVIGRIVDRLAPSSHRQRGRALGEGLMALIKRGADAVTKAAVGVTVPSDAPKVADVAPVLKGVLLATLEPVRQRMKPEAVAESIWTAAITATDDLKLPGGARQWAAVALIACSGGTVEQAEQNLRATGRLVKKGQRPHLRLVKDDK